MWITNKIRLQLHCVGGNSLNFSQKIYFYLQNCPVASLHKCLWMPNFISATGSQCNFWAPLKFVLILKLVSDGCTCRPATLTLCIYWSPWRAALRRATIQSQPTCWIEPFLKVGLKINRFASGVGKQKSTLFVLPGGILFPPPCLHQTCSAFKCWASERRFCLTICSDYANASVTERETRQKEDDQWHLSPKKKKVALRLYNHRNVGFGEVSVTVVFSNFHFLLLLPAVVRYQRSCCWRPNRTASPTVKLVRFWAPAREKPESWG